MSAAAVITPSFHSGPVLATPTRLAARAEGAWVWDRTGRAYVDFDNAGGSIILGHADPDIEAAVSAKRNETAASITKLEGALAER